MSKASQTQDFNSSHALRLVDSYLLILQEQKQYSPHTCSNYRRQLNKLIPFLDGQGIQRWTEIKPIHIRQMSAQLNRNGASSRSIALFLSSCRSFFQYLITQSILQFNPANNVRPPKGEKRLPKSMDVDQVSLLLESIPEENIISIRDKAIAELFYSSGLRLAELASSNMNDLDFEQQLIQVVGKGNKSRIVPVGKKALNALKKWISVRINWLESDSETALFVSQKRARLSHRSIQKRLEYWGKRAGLNASLHPHKFRHSCATHVLESSGDIRAVQELLGHSNISTTQVYTHLDFQKLAQVYDQSHPRAKK
jgi:integrase/recombinase XerC